MRFPDGSLRSLGVDSLGWGLLGTFIRADAQGALLDQVITQDNLCGPVTADGICRDGAAVTCSAQGFWSDDCAANGRQCVVTSGKAMCVCECDTTAGCESGCACDPACVDAGVDGGSEGGTEWPTESCDPLVADACGAEFACDLVDFVSEETGCRPVGTTEAYQTCSVSASPCVAGSTCIALKPDTWYCAPFCDPASPSCPGVGACIAVYNDVGTCLKPDDCDLASATSCPWGEACILVDGERFCFPHGGGAEGSSCSTLNKCRPGLFCDGTQCAKWCHSSADCSGLACVDIGSVPAQPDVGTCSDEQADSGVDAPEADAEADGGGGFGGDGGAGGSGGFGGTGGNSGFGGTGGTSPGDAGLEGTPDAVDDEDSGCGCRVARAPRSSSAWAAVGLALVGWIVRRRRSA